MRYLLYFLLIFSFPFGVLSRFSVTPSVHVYLHDVFVLFILLAFFKEVIKYLVNSRNKLLYMFMGLSTVSLFGIVMHVSSIQEFMGSVVYMLRLMAYIVIVIPLFTAPHAILNKLKISLLITGFIFITFGYLQYIFYPNLRNLYYLGWDEHLYRFFSTLLDPNFSGVYTLLILLLFLSVLLKNFKNSTSFVKVFYLFALVFMSTALLLTYSRSAYITSLIALLIYFYMLGYRKATGIVLVAFVCGIFLLPQGLGGEGVNLLRTASIFARFEASMQGFMIFLQNPIFGVGYNTLRIIQVEYGFINIHNALNSNAAAGFPNSLIVILSTTGIIGFVLTAFILYRLWRWLKKTQRVQEYVVFSHCVSVSLIAILISSLFENTLFYSLIVLWIVLEIGILKGFSRV